VSANNQATENREYLRRLLGERQPAFAAMLQAVVRELCPHECAAVAAGGAS
jgi:hypothetical protein